MAHEASELSITAPYEVTLSVQADIEAEFSQWLGELIQQMLALPGFIGARLMAVETGSNPERAVFCTR